MEDSFGMVRASYGSINTTVFKYNTLVDLVCINTENHIFYPYISKLNVNNCLAQKIKSNFKLSQKDGSGTSTLHRY